MSLACAKEGRESLRSELAVLSELLRSPYIAIQVARISSSDMSQSAAEEALKEMSADLDRGASWADAYGRTAEKHPDLKDRAKDPKSVRTLVCYLYGGIVSPTGFDIQRYALAADLPRQHLADVFRIRRGSLVIKSADAVYLYQVKPS